MHTTSHEHTTTTRRSALGFGAAIIATVSAPMLASAAKQSRDAKLIRICDEILQIQAETDALCDERMTIEDEEASEPEFLGLLDRMDRKVAELEQIDAPVTLEGIKAYARASLAIHSLKDSEGNIEPGCDGHWMALVVLESLVGENFA